MSKPLTSRHDLHHITREAIKRAVALDIIDAVDAAVMGARHGADDAAWLSDLTETAFASRHSQEGRVRHAMMCQFNDAYHAAVAAK